MADRRLGLAGRSRREPSSAVWLTETATVRGEHSVDQMLSVLDADPELAAGNGGANFAGDALHSAPWRDGPAADESFALLHSSTTWRNKDYPADSWIEVVRSLRESAGLETWLAWGPGEEERARRIAEASGARALEQLVSFPELVALSRSAQIVLGGDTGPLHLAHAVGTPVVCVMGPTDPDRNGPYGAPESAVVHRLPCSFCYRRLDEPKACLLGIAPERVVERALTTLATSE